MAPDLDDIAWLVSAAAADYLRAAGGEAIETPAYVASLRKTLSAPRVHLVLEQRRLRCRAREKFPLAAQLFFTSKGLEQATDAHIAAYKAERFAAEGEGVLADLCCGVGGDLMALPERRTIRGVERDPATAMLAEANCRIAGRNNAAVLQRDVRDLSPADFAAWHCDPDRRASGTRTTNPQWHEPSLEELDRWHSLVPHSAIKLAPAASIPEHWKRAGECEWIGRARECKQCVIWRGDLAHSPGQRRATIVGDEGKVLASMTGEGIETVSLAGNLGRYVCEPHAAVLAAGLAGAAAQRGGLRQLSAGVAYFTCDDPPCDFALATFKVRDALPFDERKLRAYLREQRIGKLEIKKRGVDVRPESLAGRLCTEGDRAATLILSPHGGRTLAIVCERHEA